MKTCFKCGVSKPIGDFYKSADMTDGHVGKCKECTKADVAANYRANREHYRSYERERFKTPKRKAQAAEARKLHRARYPERYKARGATGNAIRDGKLIRKPCEVCGDSKSQAHHEDYSKPLDVRWLCFECHRKSHGQLGGL